jgi:hypothetical protein
MKPIYIAPLAMLLSIYCTQHSIYPPDTNYQITIPQGLWGNVWFWEGNFMPPVESGTITPVVRDVYIYEPTSLDQVDQVGYSAFYTQIHTQLIAKTESNETGFFQIALSSGEYSVFVKEDTLFYANGFNGDGIIMLHSVSASFVTKVQIDITYKAYY